MKRLLSLLICAIFGALQVYAYDFKAKSPSGHMLYYDYISQEEKTVNVTFEKNGNEPYEDQPVGDLIIPGKVEYDGEWYAVIGVGQRNDRPFFNCTKLTSVTIQEGVKVIGDQAFQECTKIKTIVLPNSLEELHYPFAMCKNLQSITLSNSLTSLDEGLFWGCESLESVEIPNSVTTMGTSVFYLCHNLKSVKLPDGLTKIRESTFRDCESLSSITLPSNLTTIGKEAFQYCESLTSIVIPASVNDIDVNAFDYCKNLQSVFIESKTPPALGENAFPEDVKIYVPCDAIEEYMNDEDWLPYKSNLRTISHKIFVKSSNPEYGNVTVELANGCDDEFTATLTAISNNEYNYQFGGWNDGNKENPRTITVTEDLSFTAIFGKKPQIINLETVDPICTSATGSASFDVTNGVAPYTILWNDGNTDNPRTGMTYGEYYFVATDAESYTSDTTYVTLSPNEENMPQVSLHSTNPICETENGAIEATVSGGTEPYIYSWSESKVKETTLVNFENGTTNNQSLILEYNKDNNEDYYVFELPIENSGATGSEYSIHVQRNLDDNYACQVNLFVEEELLATPETLDSYGVSFYHKGSSVVFYLQITGYGWNSGYTIPYHSDWTKVDISWKEMNIETYQISYVSDFTWAVGSNPDFWIDELSILSYDDAESFSSDKDVQNLAAGQYMFSVTDSYGCETTTIQSLSKDYSLLPSVELESINPICETENGSIVATITNGTEPYTYQWSDGETGKDRENLAEGNYTIIVSDSYGCTTTETVILEKDYSNLPQTTIEITNPICETANGEILANVVGGTEPYAYNWTHPIVTETSLVNFEDDITGIPFFLISTTDIYDSFNYKVTELTKSAGGANNTDNATHIQVSMSSIDYFEVQYDLTGIDLSNTYGISFYHKGSSIQFVARENEETPSYTIPYHEEWTFVQLLWEDFSVTQENINSFTWYALSQLESETYDLWLDEISVLSSESEQNLSATQKIEGLSEGFYNLTLTDANGCMDKQSVTLTKDESNKPVITKSFTNAICGHDVGEISISYENGNGELQYAWNDGSTELQRENLAPGIYIFTISDEYGCTASDVTEIKAESFEYQPELALVTVSQQSPANLVVWQKEETEAIDFYSIYRETTSANVYEKIEDVPFNQTSIYVDENTDSQTKAYRYKISATDYCGNESPQSPNHKTINATASLGVGGVVNLIWDGYEGFDFSTYSIYRITKDGTTEIDKVPSTNWTYVDKNVPQNTLSYFVAVELPAVIDVNKPFVKAESGPFSLAMSNIAEVENQGTAIALVDENMANVYSAHNAIVVENAGENQITICNAIGQTIARAKGENNRQKIFAVESGIYIVIVGNKAVKVVVE